MWKWATLYVDYESSGRLLEGTEADERMIWLVQVTYGGNFYLARMEHEATDLRYEQPNAGQITKLTTDLMLAYDAPRRILQAGLEALKRTNSSSSGVGDLLPQMRS